MHRHLGGLRLLSFEHTEQLTGVRFSDAELGRLHVALKRNVSTVWDPACISLYGPKNCSVALLQKRFPDRIVIQQPDPPKNPFEQWNNQFLREFVVASDRSQLVCLKDAARYSFQSSGESPGLDPGECVASPSAVLLCMLLYESVYGKKLFPQGVRCGGFRFPRIAGWTTAGYRFHISWDTEQLVCKLCTTGSSDGVTVVKPGPFAIMSVAG